MNSRFDKAMDKEISEQELLQMEMVGGGTILNLINKHPEIKGWRSAMITGAYRCLEVGWPLHEINISVAARGIAREKGIEYV